MKNLIKRLLKSRYPYKPLITVEISSSAIVNNLEQFQGIAKRYQIAPVLKSNAYGHGLLEVARILDKSHIRTTLPFLIVDSYFEAVALKSDGNKLPILIIGYTPAETIVASNLPDVSFNVTGIETLREISKAKFGTRIQLKIDTGMARQGILLGEVTEAIEIIKNTPNIILEGVCSHLSSADSDITFTHDQINKWNKVADNFSANFFNIKYFHLSATDGYLFDDKITANVSRLGIGLYGLSENPELAKKLKLTPALQMQTILTGVKRISAGDTVGYGNTFKAEKNMTIGTIPVGYFEGLDRRLSSKGTILVGTERIPCPIIGRVSMNITTIDISSVPGAKIGLPVIAISNNPSDSNSIASMAKLCGTITYDLAVRIAQHLKRVVV